MFYSEKRMEVFGMQKRENITKVFSSNIYIRNTENRTIFRCVVRKLRGLYKKYRKNRTKYLII